MTTKDWYAARWQGQEYEASPDGNQVRLYHSQPLDGFEEVTPGRYRRIVPDNEVELVYVRTTCSWRGQPFIVLGEHETWYRVEYTGGLATIAEQLKLEEFDYGVYQGWAPRSEVRDLAVSRV